MRSHTDFLLVPKNGGKWWPWITLNGAMAVILRYFIYFCSFGGQLCQSRWSQTHTVWKQVYPKESSFRQYVNGGDMLRDHWETSALNPGIPTRKRKKIDKYSAITWKRWLKCNWKRCHIGCTLVSFTGRKWHTQHCAHILVTANYLCTSVPSFGWEGKGRYGSFR